VRRRSSREASYFPLAWASDIVVDHADDEQIVVSGKLQMSVEEVDPERDVYYGYRKSVKTKFGQKRTGQSSPHICFANANTDAELLAFVGHFGPIAASEISTIEPPDSHEVSLEEAEKIDWRVSIRAVQDMQALRRERRTYAAALAIVSELQRGEKRANGAAIQEHVSRIADGVWFWPDENAKETRWLAANSTGSIGWTFSSSRRDYISLIKSQIIATEPLRENSAGFSFHPFRLRPYRAGHTVICELVNSFQTEVLLWPTPIEAPPFRSWLFGVRPLLYLILKDTYLGRGGARLCTNDRCGRFFESERAGQQFCSSECSQRYRQRKYWIRSGSKKRKVRRRQRARKVATTSEN
jgi:hypothetical protein